jgi:energy-coupling factor transporter ATP-binding protein EcfA2
MPKDDVKLGNRKFPSRLLKAESSERLAWFDNRAVDHQKMDTSKKHLRRMLKSGRRYPVILLVGPTGIGKSTLLAIVKNEIIRELLPTLEVNPGLIPIASVDAIPPENGSFNWKEHYTNCLAQLREILILNKLKDVECELCRGKIRLNDNPRVSAPTFRHALVHALIHRRPVGFFIDEAQHLIKIASGRGVLDQMDVIKAIASATHIPHVLFGTYDLLLMRNLNGQLSRRNFEIHFCRYKYDNPADWLEFRKVLRSFESLMPIPEKPELETHRDFMYERSLGCVGTLKEWLSRALELALDESSAKLTIDHLGDTAMSVSRCKKIAEEISNGEGKLAEDVTARPALLSLLGMTEGASRRANRSTRPGDTQLKNDGANTSSQPKPSASKRGPFEQKPKRHTTERRKRAA